MEASSMTRRSQSSGNDSSRLKPPADGSASSRRWMVIASSPVLSARRLAARPVGAQSATSTHFGAQNAEQRIDQRRLADTGTAGDDQHLRAERDADRFLLAVGE